MTGAEQQNAAVLAAAFRCSLSARSPERLSLQVAFGLRAFLAAAAALRHGRAPAGRRVVAEVARRPSPPATTRAADRNLRTPLRAVSGSLDLSVGSVTSCVEALKDPEHRSSRPRAKGAAIVDRVGETDLRLRSSRGKDQVLGATTNPARERAETENRVTGEFAFLRQFVSSGTAGASPLMSSANLRMSRTRFSMSLWFHLAKIARPILSRA